LFQVKITASWALANICDSIRHCIDDFPSKPSKGGLEVTEYFHESSFFFFGVLLHSFSNELLLLFVIDSNADSSLIALLTECALRLTKDGDKVIVVIW
jgi:hypothetical protein